MVGERGLFIAGRLSEVSGPSMSPILLPAAEAKLSPANGESAVDCAAVAAKGEYIMLGHVMGPKVGNTEATINGGIEGERAKKACCPPS